MRLIMTELLRSVDLASLSILLPASVTSEYMGADTELIIRFPHEALTAM